jgi:hypothetical protein
MSGIWVSQWVNKMLFRSLELAQRFFAFGWCFYAIMLLFRMAGAI